MAILNFGLDISGFDLERVGVVLSVRDGKTGKVSSAAKLNMTLAELDALVSALGADGSDVEVSTVNSSGIDGDNSGDSPFPSITERSPLREAADIIEHSEATRKRQSGR